MFIFESKTKRYDYIVNQEGEIISNYTDLIQTTSQIAPWIGFEENSLAFVL